MFSNKAFKKIRQFLEIVVGMLLLTGAVVLAFEGVPLLLIFLSHYFSEVKLGMWIATGGITLGVLTFLYILFKKP